MQDFETVAAFLDRAHARWVSKSWDAGIYSAALPVSQISRISAKTVSKYKYPRHLAKVTCF